MQMHSVRVIDLPDHDTDSEPIRQRLEAFLLGLRRQRELMAYFTFIEERKRWFGLPVTRDDLYEIRIAVGLGGRFLQSLPGGDMKRIERRATALAARRRRANGLSHVKDKEQAERIRALLGEVPAPSLESGDRADEIAAALHEEMPWMAPATEAAWHALRRSARQGEPVSIGPMLLVGPPGVGKTHWARRLGEALSLPSTVIDASQGLASFSLTGTERGWSTAQPGRPLEAMLDNRMANPVIVVDEICKSGTSGRAGAYRRPSCRRCWACWSRRARGTGPAPSSR